MQNIDLNAFEHVFKADVLKKGLSIFKNNNVTLIDKKANGYYRFLISTKQQNELFVTKKAQKISNYNCTCNNLKNACEHLCAVLFYFEKDVLGISIKEKKKQLKTKTPKLKKNNFKNYLYGIEYSELLYFIEKECERNPLLKLQITTNFYTPTNQTIFENYCNKFKIILWNYLEIGKINEDQTAEVLKKISDLKHETLTTNNSNLYYYNLALISELPLLFKLITGSENCFAVIFEAISFINAYLKSTLNTNQIEALKLATYKLIKSNRYFNINFSAEIIKHTISLITDTNELLKLKNGIDRLKNGIYFLSALNNLEILKQHLAIKYSKLTNIPILKIDDTILTEHTIAKAELLLKNKKYKAGFLILENLFEELERKSDFKIISVINYIVNTAHNYNEQKIEIKYLQHLLVYDTEINIEILNKLKILLSTDDFNTTVDLVVVKLKQKNAINSPSKIINLLNYCNRLIDIISELKLQHNQFSLLHTIAIKNLPNYSIELLDVYAIHFTRAIQDAKYDFLKEPIFKLATNYINKLTLNSQSYLVTEILKAIPKSKGIHQLIKKTYPTIN